MKKIINVPIEMLKSRKLNKKSFECLACALIIKSHFQNSVLFLNVTHVMDVFGVSYYKAVKLINWFKEDYLFIYNKQKNCVFAKSLKSKTVYRYGRKKWKKYNAMADTCVKIAIGHEDTLRMVTCELRNKLLINAIRNHEHDNLLVGDYLDVTKQNVRLAISQRKLARSFGMSKSSAGRYVGCLVNDKRVSKSEIVAECVIPFLTAESESDWYRNNPKKKFKAWHNPTSGFWSGWIVYGCVYSVIKRDDSNSFKHVIWTHSTRKSNVVYSDGILTPDGEKNWAKHQPKRLNINGH